MSREKSLNVNSYIVTHKLLISVIAAVSFYFICFLAIPILFETNDDSAIQMILSGSLSNGNPEPHAVYINYYLGLLISNLFRLIPIIPWWTILHISVLAISITLFNRVLINYFLEKATNRLHLKTTSANSACLVILIIADLILFTYPVTRMQFTITPAVACGCAIFSLPFLWDSNKRARFFGILCVHILLLVLAATMRIESGLIGISFYIAVLLSIVIFQKSASIRKLAFVLPFLISVVVIAGLYIGNKIEYNKAEWQQFEYTNTNRSLYMDYPHSSYEDEKDLYSKIGWSETLYRLVHNWCFMDQAFTGEAFSKICQENPSSLNATPYDWLFSWLKRESIFNSLISVGAFEIFLSTIFVSLYFTKNPKIKFVILGITLLSGALLSYLSLLGRFILRAMLSVIIPSGMAISAFIVIDRQLLNTKTLSSKIKAGIILISIVEIVLSMLSVMFLIYSAAVQNGGYGRILYLLTAIFPGLLIIKSLSSFNKTTINIDGLNKMVGGAYIFLCIISALLCVNRLQKMYPDTNSQLVSNQKYAAAVSAVDNYENLIFIVPTVEFSTTDPLITNMPENLFPWGGWPYYAPWRQEAMQSITNDGELLSLMSLLKENNVVLMTSNPAAAKLVDEYLEEKTDEDIKYEVIASSGEKDIYKFSAVN